MSNLASTFRGSIRIKAHEKFWRKGSVGVSRDCPNFLGIPYYPRNGKSYVFQSWPVYSEGPSEQNPVKNFGEKGEWTYPGTAQFFQVPPIISGTAKAAIFTFCTHIYSLNRNKSPLKISGKVAVGIVRDSRKFSWHPYILRNAHRVVIFATAELSCLFFLFIGLDLLCKVTMKQVRPITRRRINGYYTQSV